MMLAKADASTLYENTSDLQGNPARVSTLANDIVSRGFEYQMTLLKRTTTG